MLYTGLMKKNKSLKDVYQTLQPKKLDRNYRALDNVGEFLFNCDRKKAMWYINKNLAAWVDDETFQLNFKPKGNGNREYGEYFTEFQEVQCTVCGVKENLTKHHIVPRCYRKHFPDEVKGNCHFDVLLICVDCHEKIERNYDEAKFALDLGTSEFNPPETLAYYTDMFVSKYKYLKNHNKQRLNEILAKIEQFSGESFESPETAYERFNDRDAERGSYGERLYEYVSKGQPNLKAFILMWRELFVKSAKPRFLPKGWIENYKTHFKWEREQK